MLPTTDSGSPERAQTPGSHISPSMTSQHHMSLTDRPSVCFPLQDQVHFLCSLCFRPKIKKKAKISLLNAVFTLCERFEGKHKAATQWVDYKLGLSFKQTEVINTEFPHTQLAGPSLLASYCGSNTDEAYPCTLMHLCVCACIVFAPLCTFQSSI